MGRNPAIEVVPEPKGPAGKYDRNYCLRKPTRDYPDDELEFEQDKYEQLTKPWKLSVRWDQL